MNYEDIQGDKLPQAVQDEMTELIQLEPAALVARVLSWDELYRRWAATCRKRTLSDRLSRINDGTFITLAEQYEADGDEVAGTLLTTLWCMPDEFLDDVIRIHQAAMAA